MIGTKEDLINYRITRAKDTLDDAHILAEFQKEKVLPYFEPVKKLIEDAEKLIVEKSVRP